MPKSIGLICSSELNLDTILYEVGKEASLKVSINVGVGKSIQLLDELTGSYVDFMLMSDQSATKDEYITNDLLPDEFRKDLDDKVFYLVSYDDSKKLRNVLKKILLNTVEQNCWVDDDDGNIFDLSQFA